MSRRSLLIDTSQLDELRLDGPSLCIRSRGRSRQRFPLRRISQIICIGLPGQGLEALFSAAREGIPVSFFNRRGRIIAQLIHPGALPNPLSHWLEATEYEAPLQTIYDDWLENQLRHTYGMLGCVARNSRQSSARATEQLKRLAKATQSYDLLKDARPWIENLLGNRIRMHGTQLGVAANSTRLAAIVHDLQPAGTTLCLTWLLLAARDHGPIAPIRVPAYFEGVLAKSVDDWIRRALFTLTRQLERRALSQDAPPPEDRA